MSHYPIEDPVDQIFTFMSIYWMIPQNDFVENCSDRHNSPQSEFVRNAKERVILFAVAVGTCGLRWIKHLHQCQLRSL